MLYLWFSKMFSRKQPDRHEKIFNVGLMKMTLVQINESELA